MSQKVSIVLYSNSIEAADIESLRLTLYLDFYIKWCVSLAHFIIYYIGNQDNILAASLWRLSLLDDVAIPLDRDRGRNGGCGLLISRNGEITKKTEPTR